MNVSLHEAPLSFSSPAFFLSLSLSLIYIYILESIFSTCDQQVNHHFHHIYLGVNFN